MIVDLGNGSTTKFKEEEASATYSGMNGVEDEKRHY
jgi:hypothetical protein